MSLGERDKNRKQIIKSDVETHSGINLERFCTYFSRWYSKCLPHLLLRCISYSEGDGSLQTFDVVCHPLALCGMGRAQSHPCLSDEPGGNRSEVDNR